MNIQIKDLTIIVLSGLLVSACSNSPKIVSSSDDQLVVKAEPESYLDAYDLATKECSKKARIAQYITNGTDSLDSVAFNCFDPNAETEATADAGTNVETTSEERSQESTEDNITTE